MISVFAIIAPRIEFFWLEEWVEHHLNLGVDNVYLYNNGYTLSNNDDRKDLLGVKHVRNLTTREKEEGVKWIKKPDLDYFPDFTDEEIEDRIQTLPEKYPVKIIPWVRGVNIPEIATFGARKNRPDLKDGGGDWKHNAQLRAFKDACDNFKSDWWLVIDPDEFINLKQHDNLQDLIKSRPKAGALRFGQRVFKKRNRDVPVRAVTTWGYNYVKRPWKCIIKKDIAYYDIHLPRPKKGKTILLKPQVAVLYHYRGNPTGMGHSPNSHKFPWVEKTDKSMLRYL